MTLFDQIYNALGVLRQNAFRLYGGPTDLQIRLLIHPEKYRELKAEKFNHHAAMQRLDCPPQLFDMKIIESADVDGWEIAIVLK